MADPSDLWFWLLALGAAVGGGGWFAFRWLHIARMIEDTPTSRVRSAAQGYVEVAGRCRPLDGARNLAPLPARHLQHTPGVPLAQPITAQPMHLLWQSPVIRPAVGGQVDTRLCVPFGQPLACQPVI